MVATVALVLALSNRSTPSPNGLPIIVTPADYTDSLNQVKALSQEGVFAFNTGEELTQVQKDNIKKSALILDNMDTFKPDEAAGFFEAGLCYYIVGDSDTALNRIQQSLNNAQVSAAPITAKDKADLEGVVGDCHSIRGLILFDRRDYRSALDEMNEALKHVKRPNIYVYRARVEIQLADTPSLSKAEKDGLMKAANNDVKSALALDVGNPQAHKLEGFFKP